MSLFQLRASTTTGSGATVHSVHVFGDPFSLSSEFFLWSPPKYLENVQICKFIIHKEKTQIHLMH